MCVPLFVVALTELTVISTTPAVNFVIFAKSQAMVLTSANVLNVNVIECLQLRGTRTIFFIAQTKLTVIVQPPSVDFVLSIKQKHVITVVGLAQSANLGKRLLILKINILRFDSTHFNGTQVDLLWM